jgi:hypothetical protein
MSVRTDLVPVPAAVARERGAVATTVDPWSLP